MYDNIHEIIEIKLKLLFDAKNQSLMRMDFVDRDQIKSNNVIKFIEYMENMGLIDIEPLKGFKCDLTKFGYDVYKNGGWLKFLSDKKIQELELKNKKQQKVKLEFEISVLTKDNLEHLKKIRDQENRIRNLEEQIKLISLIKLYWWFIPVLIFIGIILGKIIDSLL